MEILHDVQEWVRLAIADFTENKLYGEITIVFQEGRPFRADKKITGKFIQTQGVSTHGNKTEFRNTR